MKASTSTKPQKKNNLRPQETIRNDVKMRTAQRIAIQDVNKSRTSTLQLYQFWTTSRNPAISTLTKTITHSHP